MHNTDNTPLVAMFSFSLKKIHLIEKALNLVESRNRSDEFSFEISLRIKGNPELRESIHFMEVVIKGKENGVRAGLIRIACTFSIPEYDQYIVESGSVASLPQDLLYLLNTVVIGTMRGVMFSEFRGTALNNAYLPVLDPRGFQKMEQ